MTFRTIAARPGGDAEWVQGLLLSVIPVLLVMTAIVPIPVIPSLLRDFSHLPNAAVVVPLIVVVPTLAIAVSSIAAGVLGDRIGRRRLLEISAALFAVAAILPFWLTSYAAILAS